MEGLPPPLFVVLGSYPSAPKLGRGSAFRLQKIHVKGCCQILSGSAQHAHATKVADGLFADRRSLSISPCVSAPFVERFLKADVLSKIGR
jgi:hypothetical protein